MIHNKLVIPVIILAVFGTARSEEMESDMPAPVEDSVVVDIREEGFPTLEELELVTDEIQPEASEEPEDSVTDAVEEPSVEAATVKPELLEEEPAADANPGLAVRVEKMQSGDQTFDPKQVRIMAPFTAKLLARTPDGWRIERSESAPDFTREVELAPGRKISLTVHPHVLVPDADGASAFGIAEPGFSAPLGYHQNATVGAILSKSIRQLDNDSAELGKAIDQLQQLLVSLPKTADAPAPPKNSTKENKRQK
jgi:hypothetical protein